ncbi:MAG: bactofilin family protein, partial [Shewanella sp.]
KKTAAPLSFIAKGTKLTGNMELLGDMLIGGEVHGQILSQANIMIEQGGRVEGEIKCQEFIVDGYFKGRLICERLVIQGHGVVDGDVASTAMQIMEGGQFIGLRIKEDVSTIQTHSLAAPYEAKSLTLNTAPIQGDVTHKAP